MTNDAATSGTRKGIGREDLLSAAVRTIRRDGADASMNDIAAEAGITKPILYQHFSSKAGLAAALADRFLAGLGRTLADVLTPSTPPQHAVPAAIRDVVEFAAEEPALFRFLTESAPGAIADEGDPPMVAALTDLVATYLCSEAIGLEDQIRARTWAVGVLGMVIAAVAWWHHEQPDRDRNLLIDDLSRFVLSGLDAGRGRD